MSEMFKLVAKLTLDTSDFDKNTDQAKEKAGVFSDVLKADLVGKGISAAWDGLKRLGGAVKDFATDAVMSYGEIEQLKGGIETLFGDSAQKVLADADQAFRTAGMSAADYMDTSIQSAASLINSLGGNQERAAELMNMSITDMADNVNKMGTNMEAVQNAYRGFSRGNFTMLDNLALGFAGTKEGMQELIDKANEIRQGKDLDLRDLTIDSYADIVQAIHEVQDEMGVTGTTAKEASGTIQGSLGAMKSAWENLVAGIADPNADFGALITNFTDSAETSLDNIVPAVGRTLSGIGTVIKTLAPVALQKIPEVFNELAPDLGDAALSMIEYVMDTFAESGGSLLSAGMDLVKRLGEGFVEGIPEFLEQALPMIEQFSETFREGAGQLVDVGIDFILNLVQGIMDSLPTLIEQVPQIIINFAGAINDNAPKLLIGGVKLIITIVQGIISAIPTLIANIPKIFEAILAVWTALNWINLGKQVISFIKNGIEQLATNLPQALKDIGNRAIEWFKGVDWAHAGKQVIDFIKTAILGVATHVPTTLLDIGRKAIEWFKGVDWSGVGRQAIDFIKSAIQGVATKVPEAVLDIANKAWDWFNDVDWYSLGSNIIDGIVNGLNAGIGWLKEKARQVAEDALNAAKNFLDINSPSRKFRDEVGKMIPAGIAVGIDDNAAEVIKSAESLSKSLMEPFGTLETSTVPASTYQTNTTSLIAQAIAANNEALIDRMYEAMLMAMQDGGFGIILDGREIGRVARENGVVMV
ncbi:MAG: hypothetical protein SPL94_06610 [Oribacterium sp.]|nr:hypothetical protein [Oribacterium sp.]